MTGPCPCGAHSQHRLYSYQYANPGASLVDAARSLGLSEGNARMIAVRLRRRPDYGRLCPLCFAPDFYNGVCQKCGFESGAVQSVSKAFAAEATDPDHGWAFPVHRILPGRGLGSELTVTDLAAIARQSYGREDLPAALLRTHARHLAHLTEPHEVALLKAINSDLLQELKAAYPDDGVSDMAARLARDEVREFGAKYPTLLRAKGLRKAVVSNVLERLRLLYPRLAVAPLQVLEGGRD